MCGMISNPGGVFIGWWGTKFEFLKIFFEFFGALTVKNG
jgi:hypothetical protein